MQSPKPKALLRQLLLAIPLVASLVKVEERPLRDRV